MHRKRLRTLVPVAWMAVIWGLSSLPAAADQTIGGIWIPVFAQKMAHVIVYGALGVMWFWVFDGGRVVKAPAVWSCCLVTAYAAIDEFHQTFVPGRFGSPRDVALDTVGAALAVIVIARLWGKGAAEMREGRK